MLKKRIVLRNASAATIQVVVSGLLMFFLYRYLLAMIGAEKMGIWSVVLATTSASRITELGLTGSVVKFVAKYVALDDFDKVGDVIQTSILSLGLFLGIVIGLAYFPSLWVLSCLLPAQALQMASNILPFALLSLWLTTTSGVLQSGLDGCQRTDLRALFNIINSVLTMVFALLLVPRFGLLGLAYSQLILAALLLVLGWIFLKVELKILPILPYRWSRVVFKEIVGYGVNFQLISIISMLFDPVTKGLLSKFGGLSIVAYYEMASRMVSQLRGLLIAPTQILVPVIATLQERDLERIPSVYRDSYRLQVYLSIPLYTGILSAIPWVSQLWIGYYQPAFVTCSVLITAGYFMNSLINPAYFCYMGTGKLKWNTWANVAIGVLNISLGLILGMFFGGTGVVVAWVTALSLGSFVVLVAFHLEYHIPFREVVPSGNFWLMLASTVGVVVVWFFYRQLQPTQTIFSLALLCSLTFVAAIILPGWYHPMRIRLMELTRR